MSSSQSKLGICVQKRTHRVFAELTEFAPQLSEFLSKTVLSKQHSARFLTKETSFTKDESEQHRHHLGLVFGRTDFSLIFIVGPPDFLADFVAGFFLLIFVGKKCPEKSYRKISGKIMQNLYDKYRRHISAEGPGQHHTCAAVTPRAVWKQERRQPR